jgi:hypothetical protein
MSLRYIMKRYLQIVLKQNELNTFLGEKWIGYLKFDSMQGI